MQSVDDFKSYVQGLTASDMPKRLALSSVYQYFMSNFTNGQNFTMPDLIAWLRSRPAFGDGAIIVILGKYAFDGLTNSEVFLRIAAETGIAPKSINEVEMLMGVDVVPGAKLPFVVVDEPSRQIVAPEVVTTPAAPSDETLIQKDAIVKTPALVLPANWDNYSAKQKITWFNANQVKPSQLIAAGVSTSDIAWMRTNGYIVQETAPAAGAGAGLLLALASLYFLGS